MIGTIEHPLHPKLGKSGNPVSIVGDQGILPRNVASHDNSIQHSSMLPDPALLKLTRRKKRTTKKTRSKIKDPEPHHPSQ